MTDASKSDNALVQIMYFGRFGVIPARQRFCLRNLARRVKIMLASKAMCVCVSARRSESFSESLHKNWIHTQHG